MTTDRPYRRAMPLAGSGRAAGQPGHPVRPPGGRRAVGALRRRARPRRGHLRDRPRVAAVAVLDAEALGTVEAAHAAQLAGAAERSRHPRTPGRGRSPQPGPERRRRLAIDDQPGLTEGSVRDRSADHGGEHAGPPTPQRAPATDGHYERQASGKARRPVPRRGRPERLCSRYTATSGQARPLED